MASLTSWWRAARRGSHPSPADAGAIQLVRDGDHWFLAQPGVTPDQWIISHNTWEPEQRACLRRLVYEALGDGETYDFIDVGAYGGSYSLDAARDRRCARVIAFEPDRRNRRHLEANLFVNGLADRVDVRPVAVSQINGHAVVHKSAAHPTQNFGGCGIIDPGAYDQSVAETVETITLDSALDQSGRVLGVKIDVEGHEREVINGMRRILAENRCVLQVEVWTEDHGTHIEEILSGLGYRNALRIGPDRYYTRSSAAA